MQASSKTFLTSPSQAAPYHFKDHQGAALRAAQAVSRPGRQAAPAASDAGAESHRLPPDRRPGPH
ncbi:Protein of unknown function [Micromonospora lupini str. Lupac 08]|uniref:Uncharacterized protein n=1 Tax=Micromonospora lupini str. Lupac 08 TaxID=1150864 RepID=I0LC97_9ACTN|nr:Protein of unknown function [Micromonospora lupini str. Lupac 08]